MANDIQLAKDGFFSAAEDHLMKEHPAWLAQHHTSVLSYLKKQKTDSAVQKKFELSDFKSPLPPFIDRWWNNNRNKYTMFVGGKAGIGKTELMVTLFNTLGKEPLLVSNIDQLKDVGDGYSKYSGIIFDDCQLNKQTGEQFIQLLNVQRVSSLNVKYGTTTIPEGLPRCIVSNLPLSQWIPSWVKPAQREAMERRCFSTFLTEDLFIKKITNNLSEMAILPHNYRHEIIDLTALGYEEEVIIHDTRTDSLKKTTRKSF